MVGRNDPCPCGSGKKYKKCCAVKQEQSIDNLAENEIDGLVDGYFRSVFQTPDMISDFENYQRIWSKSLADVEKPDSWENVMFETYIFLERENLWNRYLMKMLNGPIHTRTRTILEGWQEPILVLARLTEISGDLVSMEQVLEHGTYEFRKKPDMNLRAGSYVFGFALPDERVAERGVEFISGFDYVWSEDGQLTEEAEALAEASGLSDSREFYRKHVVDLYKIVLKWASVPVSARLSPEQREACDLLLKELGAIDANPITLEFAERIYVSYYVAKAPNVRKYEGVAAAVFLLLYEMLMLDDVYFTQADIAKMFGVSVSSMKKHMDPLYELLDEIEQTSGQATPAFAYYVGTLPRVTERANWEMYCMAERQAFETLEEAQQFFGAHMNEPFIPQTAQEEAQSLCYDAYEKIGEHVKVRDLARKAQALDPGNVDATLLLAHTEESFAKAERHMKKAIQLGETTFDPTVDNTWFLVTNRPYLRALLTYGVELYEEGIYEEASEYFGKLLEINPDDNQGVRNIAIATYLKSGELSRAKKLLDAYDPVEESDPVHSFLLWHYEYMKAKEAWTPKVEKLYQDALGKNPYVETLQQEDLPKLGYPRSLDVEPGSIDEAMYIWSLI